MHLRAAVLGLAGICSLTAQDSVERVFSFRQVETPQLQQEVFNALRSVAGVQNASLDRAARAITVTGPATQIAAAEWTFKELDRPDQPSAPNPHEFTPEGMGDAVVCVYTVSQSQTPQSMQEMVNAARSVADIQRLFPVSGIHAVVMRGTAAQVALAKWMLQQLDAPSPATAMVPVVRPYAATEFAVRIFFLANIQTPQALMEVVNAARSVADVQRFFPVNQTHSIVMRGTAEQAELCEWMMQRLDTAGPATAGEFVVPNGVVRLFIPTSGQPLQELVNRARSESQAVRVYPVNARAAVAFRGTAAQAELAAGVLK